MAKQQTDGSRPDRKLDSKAIRLEARLGAIEYMIAELFKKLYAMNETHYKDVQKEHEFLRKYLRKMTLPIPDPGFIRSNGGRNVGGFRGAFRKDHDRSSALIGPGSIKLRDHPGEWRLSAIGT